MAAVYVAMLSSNVVSRHSAFPSRRSCAAVLHAGIHCAEREDKGTVGLEPNSNQIPPACASVVCSARCSARVDTHDVQTECPSCNVVGLQSQSTTNRFRVLAVTLQLGLTGLHWPGRILGVGCREGFLPPLLHGGLSIFSGHTIDQLGHAQLPRFPCLLFFGRGDDFRRQCLQLLRGVINGTDFVTHGVTVETMFYNQSDVVLTRVPVYCERVFAQSALTSRAASFSPSIGSTFSSWEFDACHCLKPHLRDPHHPHCPTLTHSLSANSEGAL
jgi:hypothetical protein